MRKLLTVVIAIMLVFALSGCESNIENVVAANEEITGEEVEPEEKLSIITSLYPQYDFTRSIVGDKADVILILPPGVESHSFEPTPQDMVMLQNSDLFLYTGKEMEPWAYRLTGSINATIVDLSEGIELMDLDAHEDEDEHDDELMDPHIWTDPNLAIVMVDNILSSLKEIDEKNAEYYEENANTLKKALMDLDLEIRETLSKTTSKTILSGGHFAFGYFVERYGLEHMSPYEGFSPDAEPTPRRIAALIETIKETDARAIFYEELIDPKVSRVISEETGIEMLLLHGAHNVTKEEFEAGKSYITFMKENLERLKIGLGYDE
ncbi:MAG: zinc ABC transporter substrate-binding protein [Clostridia bacterium]|nr:zinc ABC transporter substrate-binding protein [Clostridia bacterium]